VETALEVGNKNVQTVTVKVEKNVTDVTVMAKSIVETVMMEK
jgi:nucleoside recognition membrane protein YjiH